MEVDSGQPSGPVDTPMSAAGSSGSSAKLFLGGLSWDTNEDKLKAYFSKYGDVEDVVVMKDRVTRKPRGFGFITFKDAASAQAACSETHTIDGRQIDAKPSVPHGDGQAPRSKKIFVGGLAPETDDAQFKSHFEQFGKVVEAQVMVDHTSGRSRGFGFVTFENEDAVAKVFTTGSMHELGGKQVEVKSATPKGSGPQSGRGGGRGSGRSGQGGRGYSQGGYGPGYGGYEAGYQGYYGGQGGQGYYPFGPAAYGGGYGGGYGGMMGWQGYGYYGQPYGGAAGGPSGGDSRYHPYGPGGHQGRGGRGGGSGNFE